MLGDYFKMEEKKQDKPDHLICQFSSIGSLGPNEYNWLCNEFYNSLSNANTSSQDSHNKTTKPICVSNFFTLRTLEKANRS